MLSFRNSWRLLANSFFSTYTKYNVGSKEKNSIVSLLFGQRSCSTVHKTRFVEPSFGLWTAGLHNPFHLQFGQTKIPLELAQRMCQFPRCVNSWVKCCLVCSWAVRQFNPNVKPNMRQLWVWSKVTFLCRRTHNDKQKKFDWSMKCTSCRKNKAKTAAIDSKRKTCKKQRATSYIQARQRT